MTGTFSCFRKPEEVCSKIMPSRYDTNVLNNKKCVTYVGKIPKSQYSGI